MKVFKNEINTQVIAHRGAFKSKNLRENSVEALIEAHRLGCYASEFDVHMTLDGELIVYHDDDINGLLIAQSSLQDLMKISEYETPLLDEFLKAGKKLFPMRLLLEIKESDTLEKTLLNARKCVESVRNAKVESQTDFITFCFEAGELLAKISPNVDIAYLNGDKTPEEAQAAGYAGLDYEYTVYRKNPEWISETRELGMTINSWTVNDRENMMWLIEKGADFITTDEPELLMGILKI